LPSKQEKFNYKKRFILLLFSECFYIFKEFFMKKFLALVSLLPLCAHAMQTAEFKPEEIFYGKDYSAGKPTPFAPKAFFDYQKDAVVPVKGAGLFPLVRDTNGKLHAIFAMAIVENGAGQNGAAPVGITPSQDFIKDYDAVGLAALAEELQALDRHAFAPAAVEAAIRKAQCAMPGYALVHGGYGTMTYAGEFDISASRAQALFDAAQPKLDAVAAIVDADAQTIAYNDLFTTESKVQRSDRLRTYKLVPLEATVGAIKAAHDKATAEGSRIQSPVFVEGVAIASYVARTLALHADKLRLLE